jgi:hypothetical protein
METRYQKANGGATGRVIPLTANPINGNLPKQSNPQEFAMANKAPQKKEKKKSRAGRPAKTPA